MADTQTASTSPSGSLPPDMLNPPDSTLISGLQPPTAPQASLPQSSFDPIVANLSPPPTPAPAPSPSPPSPTTPPATPPPAAAAPPAAAPAPPSPPGQKPATAPPTPLVPPAGGQQPPATAAPTAPSYTYVGDSIAAGLAGHQKAHQTYEGRDIPAARANTSIMAASGRTTGETLAVLNADASRLNGQNVVLSTGISNDLNGGIPLDTAMTNVASQLDTLRKAGANVTLVGVGAGVKNSAAANARLQQIATAYNIPFTGELATTEAAGGRPAAVHPSDYGAVFNQLHPGTPQPQTPGTGKTIDDVTAYIQRSEGGGPFVLYGGQTYDPNNTPTKEGYYGFPDWAGATTSRGPTHAAGGAQWEPDTWKNAVDGFVQAGLANKLGHTPDFRNPDDQKAVFNYWADRRYRELTGRDIVADMNAGHVDWSALGPEWESLKYGGGGGTGMNASNLPGYQEWQRSIEGQRRTLDEESADLQRRMKDLEAGSPEHRALADQLLQKQIQLMDNYEKMIAHPPTQKPRDMISNFGSLATLIGIFAGRFANRPMVASLNAAGAAMEAMNNNDRQAYTDAFNMWKTQSEMTQNLMSMESNTYKGIMESDRLSMEEKYKQMDAAAKIYQNRLLSQQLEAGEYEKAWELAQKLDKTKDDHALAQAQIEEAHAKAEKERQEAQFPLLGTGQERSAIMTDLAAQAEKEAREHKEGDPPPRTVEELAKDPEAVQAARDRIEEKKRPAATKLGKTETWELTHPDGTKDTVHLRSDPQGNWFKAETLEPYKFNPQDQATPVPESQGRQAATQIARIQMASSELAATLTNLVGLPITANIGTFMAVPTMPPEDLAEAFKRSMALKLTDDDVKNLIYSSQGVPRFLAALENVGAASGMAGLANAARSALPAPGDSGPQVLRKYAELRQIAERGIQTALTLPGVSAEQKKDLEQVRDEIRKSVPWTVGDINALERNPSKESVSAYAQRTLQPAMPEWATGSATGPNGKQIFHDSQGNWFNPDHTPYEAH